MTDLEFHLRGGTGLHNGVQWEIPAPPVNLLPGQWWARQGHVVFLPPGVDANQMAAPDFLGWEKVDEAQARQMLGAQPRSL